MEIKSIREFLSWVDQKVFFLDENEGSVCLKNGEKAEDSLIEPYTMKLLISDIKKHSLKCYTNVVTVVANKI